jgi:hypothetical protein
MMDAPHSALSPRARGQSEGKEASSTCQRRFDGLDATAAANARDLPVGLF